MARLYDEAGKSFLDCVKEAKEIVIEMALIEQVERMQPNERKFVEDMFDMLENDKYGDTPAITPKRLFWLRDLKDRYLI